ncbi:MAG: SDR family oxidoreductase, partial [Acidimicrobiales bacterium]
MRMIADSLAGKRIAITGSTGFLGTALVERLMRSVPGCELVLLVRPGRRHDATARTKREILRNDCFDRLRSELGDRFDDEMSRRITAVAGDVSTDGLGLSYADRATFTSCDIAIHSAATVSFDSPLDAAVEVNLLGASRVAQTLAAEGSTAHLVAVSTAYVAGARRGDAPELPLPETPYATSADWRAEVDAARRARADADAESRQPERLTQFHKQARSELGAAGAPALAAKTESCRDSWVRERMVELGRARARSLGWPDAYAYTKALGERALLEQHGEVPVTIVRPSIIESALFEPKPGWIRGFRMAEPVIISYARGLLREFPGIPEGTVDVIPVDLVVAALIAVAARGPLDEPDVFQVASGSRNPLKYHRLVNLVQDYFSRNPLYDAHGQPIVVPEWSFPGRGRVQSQLERATKLLKTGEKIMAALPIRGARAEVAGKLEEQRAQAERALSYVELYGAYAETEAIYRVDRLLALYDSLDAADQAEFQFDPAVIDWDPFVQEIHLPSVLTQARVRTTPGKREGPTRHERG